MGIDEPMPPADGLDPSRVLLAVGCDLERVVVRHAPALRREGLDNVAEQLEVLAVVLTSNAQELAAALQS
jgi:hypothetical protein